MKKLCIVLCLLLAGTAGADGLLQNTTPAERMRGCSWADHFRSQASVEDTGGTVTGAPTFDLDGGITLDGTNDYLAYNLMGGEFNSANITIVFEFTPDFATNEDTVRTFFDTTSGTNYYIQKRANADSNVLRIALGNATIADIAEATYSPYWTVGQRHVIVVSGTTGDTSAWLNGNAILTNDATAWTVQSVTGLYIGARNNGTVKFDGTSHSLRVFKAQLTAAEAQDYYDHSTYKYMESATAVYQMRAEDHDPTGNRTLDSSGNGYHVTDVDDPVKLATHGYDFDGANDYHQRTDSGALDMDLTNNPGGNFSVQCMLTPETLVNSFFVSKWNGATDERGWSLYTNSSGAVNFYVSDDGTGVAGHLSSVTGVGGSLAAGRYSFIAATYNYITDGTSEGFIFVDSLSASSSTTLDGPVHDSSADFTVGSSHGGGSPFDGYMLDCRVLKGVVMTPIQINDSKMTAWKGLNRQ